MPSVGLLDGTTVFPGGVSDTTDVLCPKCGEPMHVRGGPQTDRLRHFAHYPQNRKCSGETQEHHQWKQLVFRALSNLDLPHQESLFFCLEGEVDVSNTPSEAALRRADVLLQFGDEHDNFGHGIAIEIQHRNDDKNVHAVTYDYLTNGYSVRWASRHDFTDNEFDAAAVIVDSDSHPCSSAKPPPPRFQHSTNSANSISPTSQTSSTAPSPNSQHSPIPLKAKATHRAFSYRQETGH